MVKRAPAGAFSHRRAQVDIQRVYEPDPARCAQALILLLNHKVASGQLHDRVLNQVRIG